MPKKKRGSKKDQAMKQNSNSRPSKKQKRGSPASLRSDENVNNTHTRFEQHSQSIAANDDFISLDFGDLPTTDVGDISNSRKRKRLQDDDNDDSEDITMFPWLPFRRSGSSSPRPSVKKILEDEATSLLAYLEPTKAEVRIREYLIHKIRTVINDIEPDVEVEVFGSFSTNLYLPNSDIDVVVQGDLRLRPIARALERSNVCSNPQVIEKASVPVIKFEDSLTGLKVDITLDSDSGINSAKCINKMLRDQPGLRPLTLLVKLFLSLRKHNEVFTGGLGGYAIVCMVMSFLQMHPKVASGEIDPVANIGTLLLEFFQLYGISFQMEELGICVLNRGSYYGKSRNIRSKNGKPVFTIRDPMDRNNDLGMKSYNAIYISKAFKSAYMVMTQRAFELEKMLSQNMLNPNNPNGLQLSIFSRVFYIPRDMANLREAMTDIYTNHLWVNDEAASSFNWETSELP
ncbi:hypothetical protein BDA99DRAFT_525501 [Phascolomyces articulosus]|uniref:polynucleotide adenylyltransferase n=1 Tax=Phascolomyces articulosus TaxID=60185 RepID=A0AAD5P8X9_9FUNG|nr:hypothetical protein BDA99DRAFT_525501 [Phascolomyces articulosus]